MAYDVAVLVGSLRRESWTRKLVKAMQAIAPADIKLEIVDYGDLPAFNQDNEANPVPAVTRLKERIKAADAVLFATPEYNRSVPGVLKNAIDCASRPYGQSAWSGKPAAILSVSPGAIGAFGANHHLRQSLVFLDMPAMPQPEAYVGNVASLLDDKGQLAKPETREFLSNFLKAFAKWIAANAKKPDKTASKAA
jgi:chromate reductase